MSGVCVMSQDPIFPQFSVTGTEVGYPGGKWFNPFSMAATPEKVWTRVSSSNSSALPSALHAFEVAILL